MSTLLLAVDLGVRASGMAVFEPGRVLRDWRALRFPDRTRLKAGVHGIMAELGPFLDRVVAEGDPRIAKVWAKEARRLGIELELFVASDWRNAVLLPRERRDSRSAKTGAKRVAQDLLARSEVSRTATLTDDAAEAICLGWWASEGWDPW